MHTVNRRAISAVRYEEKRRFHGYHVLYYAFLTVMALAILIPFVWLISTSFDRLKTYSLPFPPRLLPKTLTLFNYQMALNNVPIIKYLLNTLCVLVLNVAISLFVSTLSGFVFSKGQFKGKKLLFILVLSSMMIPLETKLMPMYDVVRAFGLNNKFLGVVLPGATTCSMYIFFVKQFCDDLPYDLFEAGVIDGAGKFRIYWRIFLPLMGPVIATIVVLDVVSVWNDLLWPMIALTDNNLSTIQLGLVRYNSGASGQVHAGIQTALSVLSVLPLAVVFCFMQRYIVASIAATGIKQ